MAGVICQFASRRLSLQLDKRLICCSKVYLRRVRYRVLSNERHQTTCKPNFLLLRKHSSLSFASNKSTSKQFSQRLALPNWYQIRNLPTLNQIRRQKPRTKKTRPKVEIPKDKRILLGPQRKGVCVKLVVRTPKKPNSAQRKCAVLRLSNGKLITAYIPGEKTALQEHGVVLFEGGRVQDCPGIKYKIIRRKYDMN